MQENEYPKMYICQKCADSHKLETGQPTTSNGVCEICFKPENLAWTDQLMRTFPGDGLPTTEKQLELPAPDGSAIPRALFSCSNEYCQKEVSYHADQLYWHAAGKRWVCENCWDDLPGPTDEDGRPTRGVTLAEHIIGGDFKAVKLLHNAKVSDAGRQRAPATEQDHE